ncbi:phosphotransferase enzyme family protein [Dactylosporangium sp. NPDC051541]|uniref:phosphotransferase enzyme family protein n=1 Tax=Dactylosporangium sp. NPDC051541 TaxID=3363977 RepID=UPI0037B9B52D
MDGDVGRIAARFGGSPPITPLAGPWGHSGVFRAGAVVLKCWRGPRRERGLVETAQLRSLRAAGFASAPAPVAGRGGWWEYHRDVLWTAQEYVEPVPGRPAGTAAARIGAVLARLHATEPDPRPGDRSRIDDLAGLDLAAVPAGHAPAVAAALRHVLDRRAELTGLPRGRVHGDVNFDNAILGRGGRLVLIDWEFTRRDVRVLDLATLLAPKRRPDGSFRTAGPALIARIVAGYQAAAAEPLGPDELRLLPAAALAHYLLVLRDVLAAGSPYAAVVAAAVAELQARTVFMSSSTRASSIGLAARPSTLK